MSRSPSPASSLDYFQSDGSASEDEYDPSPARRAPGKRRIGATGNGGAGKKGLTIKINLSALARARDTAAAHPADGAVEEDEEADGGEEEDMELMMGGTVVDLSNRELKKDHTARPLWVDESGHMYVISHSYPSCPGYPLEEGLERRKKNDVDPLYRILEAFAPWAQAAQDFLIAIAEPVSRLVS